MSTPRRFRLLPALSVAFLVLQSQSLFGQALSESDTLHFAVQVVPSHYPLDTLENEFVEKLSDEIKARGAADSRNPDWFFCVKACTIPSDARQRIVLSIMTLHALPNDAIEAGKREEVFYSFLSSDKRAALPGEGKWVRQLVTEEMLRQFGMPLDQELIIAERKMIGKDLSAFVDSFVSRYFSRKR